MAGLYKRIVNKLARSKASKSVPDFVKYLRSKGVQVGSDFFVAGKISDVDIDLTRPSLITIGDHVSINRNFSLMTHDFVSGVFRVKYHDFIPSSGPVKIGNNVRFGVNCTVLKNVTIGDNVFIAAGSIVTKDIPSNCIAGGTPCKPLIGLDEYYEKRKTKSVEEAFVYAQSIKKRYGRMPVPSDFAEEFPLFVDKRNIDDYPDLPVRKKLRFAYDSWIEDHVAPFSGFEEFLENAMAYRKTE